ncbi:uncharacterized protein NESG_01097 [Nematocida ausubeli]|uniref:Uncharacterized protein n=1 Tax=Nematocida ausubeli (strain ATCC PRA-371 / ERTm2) TaxID=1913371 RepID=A0A086J1G8_NEMA1|nr:uncharacterized protein NESG_01097 [Nematocida ausubeli]KAI5132535.1 hypothetical protein NEAUS07_0197 [Nematocida ausubeli]KAI5147070.1 hypothetical protein NEAUS05_0401 [Nematocida ausubeli]KFG25986.1 hypothetical protein NESG_01097 [Nematocida ausubeli]
MNINIVNTQAKKKITLTVLGCIAVAALFVKIPYMPRSIMAFLSIEALILILVVSLEKPGSSEKLIPAMIFVIMHIFVYTGKNSIFNCYSSIIEKLPLLLSSDKSSVSIDAKKELLSKTNLLVTKGPQVKRRLQIRELPQTEREESEADREQLRADRKLLKADRKDRDRFPIYKIFDLMPDTLKEYKTSLFDLESTFNGNLNNNLSRNAELIKDVHIFGLMGLNIFEKVSAKSKINRYWSDIKYIETRKSYEKKSNCTYRPIMMTMYTEILRRGLCINTLNVDQAIFNVYCMWLEDVNKTLCADSSSVNISETFTNEMLASYILNEMITSKNWLVTIQTSNSRPRIGKHAKDLDFGPCVVVNNCFSWADFKANKDPEVLYEMKTRLQDRIENVPESQRDLNLDLYKYMDAIKALNGGTCTISKDLPIALDPEKYYTYNCIPVKKLYRGNPVFEVPPHENAIEFAKFAMFFIHIRYLKEKIGIVNYESILKNRHILRQSMEDRTIICTEPMFSLAVGIVKAAREKDISVKKMIVDEMIEDEYLQKKRSNKVPSYFSDKVAPPSIKG